METLIRHLIWASDLGTYCLPLSNKKDARLIWAYYITLRFHIVILNRALFVDGFNHLYTGDVYVRTLANSEDPEEMSHYATCDISSESTLFAETKMIFRRRNTILFGNYVLQSPDIYQ